MRSKYILAAVCFLMVFLFSGCAESKDSAVQNASSSAASESSQAESGLSEENAASETGAQTETITSDSAEKIALNDLGITRSDVKYIHSYEEHDGGSIVAWCVEFEVNNTQYNYYVDMATGEILEVFEETHH